jgi:competence protein ComEC
VADLRVPLPEFWVGIAAVMTLALAMILARRRPVLTWVGLTALIATALWIALVPPKARFQPGVLEITAIDVGQGDSTLVVSPQGRAILIDAGGLPGTGHSNFDIGEDVVSPYLWWRGISRLDAVVVTHGHWDHVGGMRAVVANFRPRELWVGRNPPTPALAGVLRRASEQHVQVTQLVAGDAFDWGGIGIRVLAPAQNLPARPRRPNDDCLALKLTYHRISVLLEGDAEKPTERQIIQEQPEADLLKVGHHGSATSTSRDLLEAVKPRLAVVSVGLGNSYGHPRREVLERLADSRVAVYRTDLDGVVSFFSDGNSANLRPTGPH